MCKFAATFPGCRFWSDEPEIFVAVSLAISVHKFTEQF